MAFFSNVDFLNGRSLVKGDDFQARFRWLQGGQPVDLTGYSAVVNLYVAGDDPPLYTTTATLGGTTGEIAWEIPKEITVDLPRGEVTHSTTLTDSLGKVRTKIRGRLRVLQ